MILKKINVYDMLEKTREKTLICFGAGTQLATACEAFSGASFFERIDFIADNDRDKNSFSFCGTEKPIYPIEFCIRNATKEPVILVTTMFDCCDVIEQLNSIPELKNCDCYIHSFNSNLLKTYHLPKNRTLNEPLKIPKIIHYCWFGGAPIRADFTEYIESWKKFCPDYEIIRWDESNYDYKKNEYMYDAYKHKKWAFVSDYARLDVICQHGGVYLDTDIEIIKNIDDLLCDDAFIGFESSGHRVANYGFGAIAGFSLIMELIKMYDYLSFLNKDGSLNLKPAPKFQTDFFVSKGLKKNNFLQDVDGMIVYPSDVLDPLNLAAELDITDNTYAIHHGAGTWVDNIVYKKRMECISNIKKIYPQIIMER